MNIQTLNVLNCLSNKPYINQRLLANKCGCSLGFINKAIGELRENGYINTDTSLTEKADELIKKCRPKNAVILAAGVGLRMVPVNTEYPKALIEVDGKPLIERIIEQLHAVGITEIHVVVGFMKESFEYLIDTYGVNLIVNRDYAVKNNLYSLYCAKNYINNTYVVPCDIYFTENPFRKTELYSWYMINDGKDEASDVRQNRKFELVRIAENETGNGMIGLSYVAATESQDFCERLNEYANSQKHNDDFWEEVLWQNNKMIFAARTVDCKYAAEINTFEQLRELDANSKQAQSEPITVAARALGADTSDIKNLTALKKGMTNRSFLFDCKGKKYVMRIPGEGTDQLINRHNEAAVFAAIKGLNLCDDPEYINAENGYKITRFIYDVRPCDPENNDDLTVCMKKLRAFHEMNLKVPHDFDIFGNIDFYETLRGETSIYRDYDSVKKNVLSLKPFIESNIKNKTLCHIDSIPDNFLFDPHVEGELALQLTDWEYSGMQDPHVDIAMFCIYSAYDKSQVDNLINIYFENKCEKNIRLKIYCYIAACGLLWSNWCEYKHHLGVEFGEYALSQYRYAKDFYRIFCEESGLEG